MNKKLIYLLAIVLGLFAFLTLFLSSSIILDLFNIREKEGNFVPFVVWANFICSLLYFLALYGLLKAKNWTPLVLFATVIILIAAFIGLKIHISNGGIYELKTVNALLFRTGVSLAFTIATWVLIRKNKNVSV